MKKNQKVSYEVIIKNDPDKVSQNLINQYWVFEKDKFKNKPKSLSEENDLTPHSLYLIIKEFSHVIIQSNCKECDLSIEKEVNSQSAFLVVLSIKPLCEKCNILLGLEIAAENKRQVEKRNKDLEIEEQKNNRLIRFYKAIERFEQTRFNDEQARFMLHFMKTCPRNISLSYYNENFTVFHKFTLLELIQVEINYGEGYVAISYPNELKELLENHISQKSPISEVRNIKVCSRLSFLLENNRSYRNSNTPRYGGTMMFKEDAFFKKGTKCAYGLYEKEYNNAWLTVTPVSDIIISKNKPLHKEPEHIQDILIRFLNNPENQ